MFGRDISALNDTAGRKKEGWKAEEGRQLGRQVGEPHEGQRKKEGQGRYEGG